MAEKKGIARPYAEAAFEIAREGGQLAAWSDALHAASMAVANPQLARLIDTPGVDVGAVVDVIAAVCEKAVTTPGADSAQVRNLLMLLAENRRLPLLADIADFFDRLKTDIEKSIDVVLTAALPVSEAQQQRITAALKRRFGREVKLHFQLDESLIGGARLQADDLIIDGSVRTGLEKLSSALVN